MPYHPRIECKRISSFQTTRTFLSKLWLISNPSLEQAILGYAAKFTERYGVKLYAMSIEGNHIQFPALFPEGNRAHFMRDFNSSVARAVPRYQSAYPGGRLWARRYSAEYLPDASDVEGQFFYTVLQPVQDGLVDNIYQYPGYNCFEDAITGKSKTYPVINWKAYNDAKRWDSNVSPEDYTVYHQLKFERLPGYADLSREEYIKVMRRKLKKYTADALEARGNKASAGVGNLKKKNPGATPKKSKTSQRWDHRPRILCKDAKRRRECEAWYFDIYYAFKESSLAFRAGKLDVPFPEGTYRPPLFTVAFDQSI